MASLHSAISAPNEFPSYQAQQEIEKGGNMVVFSRAPAALKLEQRRAALVLEHQGTIASFAIAPKGKLATTGIDKAPRIASKHTKSL